MANATEIYGRKWSEKEYLVVLHHYFLHRGEAQHADTPFVIELSKVLGRTPHSILYRLQNFMSIDPEEKDPRRKGKVNITPFGKRIFTDWSLKRDSLRDTAEAFLRDEKAQMITDLFNPQPIRMPVTFRDYELLDEIGRGGFGIVLSCLHTKSQQLRAIKIIDVAKIHDRECLHRFRREIRILKTVSHANVIRIFEDNLYEEDGFPGYVMDLAEMDLFKFIGDRSRALTPKSSRPILDTKEAKGILMSVIEAVASLHESTPCIIHRDINPSNILRLLTGSWVIADFSLAKFTPPTPLSTAYSTESHVGMGTSHYASPEQYKDLKDADARTDVYALGWLLWDLFSSEGPFPRRVPSGLPSVLEGVFLKAVSFEKEDRYGSVREMQAELKKNLNEH